jgi:pimeloyl-ACP methyl ester carboxylesterase
MLDLLALSVFDWHPAWQFVFWAIVLWTLFWLHIWVRFFPIIVRLIGEAPLLVAEPSERLEGGEDCEFRTRDGLTLRGTYLKTARAERLGVIVFGHELNGDRWNAAPYVRELIAEGYDVLTFDFRNHGASDSAPGLVLRPWISPDATADMSAAVDYACRRDDADPRGVGIFAISRAAGAALCVAQSEPRIRCLFLDGAYPTRATHLLYLIRYIEIYTPYPRALAYVPHWVYEIRAGLVAALARRSLRRRRTSGPQGARPDVDDPRRARHDDPGRRFAGPPPQSRRTGQTLGRTQGEAQRCDLRPARRVPPASLAILRPAFGAADKKKGE